MIKLPFSFRSKTTTKPLPSGTVTFLFTDIEGSTRLWETEQEAMRVALARHDVLLRQSIQHNSGHIFKTGGDSFCVAFSTPREAADAALEAQRALAIEAWPGASLDRSVVVQVPVRPTKAGDTQASQRESGHYCDDYCYDHA